MKRDEVVTYFRKMGVEITPKDAEHFEEASVLDGDEGSDWLPYYKMALSLLGEAMGFLAAAVGQPMMEEQRRGYLREARDLWFRHLLLCGVGPRVDDEPHRAACVASANAALGTFEATVESGRVMLLQCATSGSARIDGKINDIKATVGRIPKAIRCAPNRDPLADQLLSVIDDMGSGLEELKAVIGYGK